MDLVTLRLSKLLNDLKYPSGVVLDIGCADGREYSELLIKNYDYIGIDIDANSIRKTQTKDFLGNNFKFETGNAEKLRFADRSFDLVVCNNMLAYTKKNKVLAEVIRVLNSNGYCISLFNNTIDYSLYKIFHKTNVSLIRQILHSIIVIANTSFFRLTGRKFFHTTFNTVNEIRQLLTSFDDEVDIIFVEEKDYGLGYKTIEFVFRKK